ncbi:hypothetical protein G3N58_25070 [Paraburkholderia sp. Ac-20342]|uniref:hypothetical protein n=1 Tax=Paraburkholderia sp. Ac-20342 TaxID=2703889 RepID=UPI001980EBA6|nr:hypothetical protein [Paraburkholderia sp. Ac-20342]MBN3850069.1 hypothetical protein [Paraburkholderia sp. Ac-20342]
MAVADCVAPTTKPPSGGFVVSDIFTKASAPTAPEPVCSLRKRLETTRRFPLWEGYLTAVYHLADYQQQLTAV